ncbi:GNAT family N-acetyltransferase [Microbacteriaceae bacterium VKM Ac-2855]|nr:GNAT family N-acetyltransferase [Microbacteriaceae bacterium VKM Ac-2855]
MDLAVLTGAPRLGAVTADAVAIRVADARDIAAYRSIRRDVFVAEQGLFDGSDHDDSDDDPRTVVLVASVGADVVGGVRLAPVERDRDLGWWTGSRLVVRRGARGSAGIGAALVRAACAEAATRGVLRFEAAVQPANVILFRRLGWTAFGTVDIAGLEHQRMRWPIDRLQRQADNAKSALGALLEPFAAAAGGLGGAGFVGDDGAPVPGSDLIAACDAIVPSMVERHPEWAGWCSVLVNVNDLTAMGADPVGLLDAVGARDASFAGRILHGLREAAAAWGVPVLGGHTQLGVPASLSVTALGRTSRPVPASGARVGDALSLTADLSGGWRPGFVGGQWDSTSQRDPHVLRELAGLVGRAAPRAAKDVSMAGTVGTAGMLAEAAGVGAVIDITAVQAPASAGTADWLSCFPGYGMLTTDAPGASRMSSPHAVSAEIGRIVDAPGIRLRWPDGAETEAIRGGVTGLGHG